MSRGIQGIENQGRRTFARLNAMQDRFQQRAQNFGKIGFGGAAVAAGVGLIGREVVNTLSEFERFEAVLGNTLGDKGLAKGVMADIQDFASKTPFQINELTDAYVKLANRGIRPNKAQMTQLGDLASSTGKGYDQLAEAVLDAGTGEFERLKEFGVRAQKSGDQVQFTFKGVTTTVANTDAAITDYLYSLGDLEGVQGSMAAQSQTVGGMLSNLKDQFMGNALAIGELFRPMIAWAIGAFAKLSQVISIAVSWLKQNPEVLYALGAALGAVAIALGVVKIATIQWNATLLANPITWIILAIAALVGALVYAWKKFEGFRAWLFALWESFKAVFQNIGDLAKGVLGNIGEMIMGVLTLDTDRIKQGFSGMKSAFSEYGKSIADGFRNGYAEGVDSFQKDKALMDAAKMEDPATGGLDAAAGLLNANSGGSGGGSAVGSNGVATAASGARSQRNITISINNLVESFNINTTNLKEAPEQARRMMLEALAASLRDVQIITG